MNIEDTGREPVDETQSIDLEAATAEISESLFGQGDDSGEGKSTEGPGAEQVAETVVPPAQSSEGGEATGAAVEKTDGAPVEGAEGAENSAAVQETGAPKTWTKEALETWATIPDRAKQEILKREEDFMRGITQYKAAAEVGQRYDKVVEPYRAVLEAEKVDPVGLFQAFAANHYLLSRGTPEQKLQLTANLINGYGIDFGQLASYIGEHSVEPTDPKIAALERELAELKGGLTSQLETARQSQLQEFQKEVEAFAADPQHPYFDELANDISQLINAGLAKGLPDAYERAVYANPVTREKELTRLAAEKAATLAAEEKEREATRQKSMGDHVRTSPTERDGTVPLGSMDDTLNETLAAINARG